MQDQSLQVIFKTPPSRFRSPTPPPESAPSMRPSARRQARPQPRDPPRVVGARARGYWSWPYSAPHGLYSPSPADLRWFWSITVDPRAGVSASGKGSSWLASRSSVDPADPLGVVLKRRAEQEPTKNDKRWRPSDHHSKQKCLKCCHCALLGTPGFAAKLGQAGESLPPLQRGS